jgi:hypothetical protein
MNADGVRLYRREQLEVVANAREARWALNGPVASHSSTPEQALCDDAKMARLKLSQSGDLSAAAATDLAASVGMRMARHRE